MLNLRAGARQDVQKPELERRTAAGAAIEGNAYAGESFWKCIRAMRNPENWWFVGWEKI